MPGLDTQTSIYMDTNILQDHFSKQKRFLDGFKLSRNYYALVKYIDENALATKVNICIPQIVIEEMKEHLFQDFESNKQSLKDKIEEYKKIFGDLLEIECTILNSDIEEYKRFILGEIEALRRLPANQFSIIGYPECFPQMIENALKTVKPFANAKGRINGKEKDYTDAGFKDALMLESIVSHCNLELNKVILFTNDGDFEGVINNTNFMVARDLNDVIDLLVDMYNLDPILGIRKKIEDQYHREVLLDNADMPYDQSVANFEVITFEASDDERFIVTQKCTINEAEYTFKYIYDSVANEIIDCEYEINGD